MGKALPQKCLPKKIFELDLSCSLPNLGCPSACGNRGVSKQNVGTIHGTKSPSVLQLRLCSKCTRRCNVKALPENSMGMLKQHLLGAPTAMHLKVNKRFFAYWLGDMYILKEPRGC